MKERDTAGGSCSTCVHDKDPMEQSLYCEACEGFDLYVEDSGIDWEEEVFNEEFETII